MRKAILLYNTTSGGRRERRLTDVESALSVLRAHSVEASAVPTLAGAGATQQVREALADGCDTVFACGGDGTIHDVLQGMVGTNARLAVIPLGTANSFAHDLGIPRNPAAAAKASLKGRPRRLAVGKIGFHNDAGQPEWRYFIMAVGIGVDAHLFYHLNPVAKRHLGMGAYCLRATRLWLTHKMRNFVVDIQDDPARQVVVSQLLAIRIRDFGGVLRKLAPGASLDRDDLRLVLFRTKSRWAYLRYVIRGLLDLDWTVAGIELTNGMTLSSYHNGTSPNAGRKGRIFVEADGELLGTLPVQISMVPDAVTVLAP